LFENGGAGLANMVPHPGLECVPSDVVPGRAFRYEHALDDVLRGDPGVIGARQPQHLPAAHPFEPH
jgi:hypothetical protein